MSNLQIIHADCRDGLKQIAEASVQCCVTSPPYWGLRSYLPKGHPNKAREIGQEKTPQQYVETMCHVAREVWRVLKPDGTFWLNLGDCYAGGGNGGGGSFANDGPRMLRMTGTDKNVPGRKGDRGVVGGLKAKDLVGIPWRVALALQADGWYLRSDIVWAKKNCMPESVTDRPTRSHEFIFLLTKSPKYFYDADAIKEPCIYDVDGTGTQARKMRQSPGDKSMPTSERNGMRPPRMGYKNSVNFEGKNCRQEKQRGHSRRHAGFNSRRHAGFNSRRHAGFNSRRDAMEKDEQCSGMRNKRDVWTVSPAQYPESHFATFPKELITPCILAGSRAGDTVLDPFGGSGTTGQVALELGRKAILCELNDDYLPLIKRRTDVTPGLQLA